jgi:hypothetical protein
MSPKTKRLSERAMLTHVRVSYWTGSKKNKKVTRETVTRKHAVQDAGHWIDHLFSKKDLSEISERTTRVRYTWSQLTLPWMDGGVRILPAARFMEYRTAMNEVISDRMKAVEGFLKTVPEILDRRKREMAELWDTYEGQIPSISEMRDKFAVAHEIYPMPDASDFRVDVGAAEAKEIKQQVTDSINNATKKAVGDLWNQLAELVGKIEEKLSDPKKTFRDSLINNLKDFCNDILPKMNFTEDESLEAMRKEVTSKLAKLDPGTLRDNKASRKKAAKTAKDIAKKIDDTGFSL